MIEALLNVNAVRANVANGIWDTLSKWNVIVGLILALIGFSLMLASGAIARKIKKDAPKEKVESLTLALKITAAVFAILGCCLAMFINM